MLAIICSGFVATRGTLPSARSHIVSNRHGPVRPLEGHIRSHMPWAVASMDNVAGPAGAPFPAAVYMYVVQIQPAVSEVGQVRGLRRQDHLVGVALEAQREVLHVKRRVERLRERTLEQLFLVGAVGIVASGAVPGAHGSVKELGLGKDWFHVRYDSTSFDRNGLVVTFETDFIHPIAKQLRALRRVWGVAVGAFVLLEKRPVRCAGFFDARLDLLVTGKAHLVHWRFQLVGELACMGLMAT